MLQMKAQSFCPLQNGKRKMYQQNNHRVKGIRVKISGNFSRRKKMTISNKMRKPRKPRKRKKSFVINVKKRNIETTKTDFFFIIFANINFRDLVITKNFANIYFREFIHNSRNSRKLMIAKINDLKVVVINCVWT